MSGQQDVSQEYGEVRQVARIVLTTKCKEQISHAMQTVGTCKEVIALYCLHEREHQPYESCKKPTVDRFFRDCPHLLPICTVILICEGTAYQLTSEDGKTTDKKEIETLRSTQEETDSRVVLYCMYRKERGTSTSASKVFFILLHYALTLKEVVILFDTGTGNKQRLINITAVSYTHLTLPTNREV